jgi:hypothetical protein
MAQVSNVQSRTLRLLGSLSDDLKKSLQALEGCVVLEKVSNDSPKTFVSASDVSKVVEILNTNNLLFRPHFYSLFVKFNTELKVSDVEKLNAKVLALVPDANVSYSRVDENGHTGKVVVDRFDDYNTLRASAGDVTFYKFNRTKAQARVNTNSAANSSSREGREGREGWKTVSNKQRAPRTSSDVGASGANRSTAFAPTSSDRGSGGVNRTSWAGRGTARTSSGVGRGTGRTSEGDNRRAAPSQSENRTNSNTWAGRAGAKSVPKAAPTSS